MENNGRAMQDDCSEWWRKWTDPKAVEDMLREAGYGGLDDAEVYEIEEEQEN